MHQSQDIRRQERDPGRVLLIPKPNPKIDISTSINTDLDPQQQLARHHRNQGASQSEKETDLDPNLEPPKDLNLMFRDQLGVGDEVPREEGC